MINLPLSLKFVISGGAVLLMYLFVFPMVNGDSCKVLAESNIGFLNRIAFQGIAGCWIPWG